MQVKYKLHGIDTVDGSRHSANNKKFYDTYDEALTQAKSYVSRQSNPCNGIVIFKAITLVEPACAPIRVTDLHDCP